MFNLTLDDLIGHNANLDELLNKTFLCNNNLIFKMNYISDSISSLDVIGILNDDINKYSTREIVNMFTDNVLFREYEPPINQILTDKFYNMF